VILHRKHSFSLGLNTTVLQAGIYTIKANEMENTQKCHTGKNTYILSDSQAVINALDNFKTNSKLARDLHQSKVKLA
jgi:hypothetical protein